MYVWQHMDVEIRSCRHFIFPCIKNSVILSGPPMAQVQFYKILEVLDMALMFMTKSLTHTDCKVLGGILTMRQFYNSSSIFVKIALAEKGLYRAQ